MKNNYFLKTVFTFIVCGFFSTGYAADWYISSATSIPAGDDINGNGTISAPWASFSKAQTAAASLDVIHVSGMIDMWSDPANTTFTSILPTGSFSTTNKTGITIAKSLTVMGTSSANDGFTGTNNVTNTTRFFQLNNVAHTLTLKNLKLANGAIISTLTTLAYAGGAILCTTGNIVAENVIFDNNIASGHNAITGGAISIVTTGSGTSFKNCVFSNNVADKAGAIYFQNVAGGTVGPPVVMSTVLFDGCSFIANESKLAFGGSAVLIRIANDNNSVTFVNCTVAKNKVSSNTNGGAIYLYKGSANTVVNIINCTISENTTVGGLTSCGGVYMLNSAGNYLGKLYVSNSIIEGNTATGGVYADFNTTSTAPTATTLQINNSIIGRHGASVAIPTGCFGSQNQFGYLTATSTTNDFKANLAPFNTTNNYYPLYTGSTAIGYGNSTFLTTLSPAVTTDQLGNVRTVGATNYAGAWESTPISVTVTPSAPTALVATAGNAQVSVAFKTSATGGSAVTNYKYSTDGGATYTECSPTQTVSPIVITGLTNGTAYTVKIKAMNINGDSPESVASNSVTPTLATGLSNELNTTITLLKNSNNQLVIKNTSSKTGTVTICNAVGQLVASSILNETTTINKSLNSGCYLVLINIDGKTRSTKVIL